MVETINFSKIGAEDIQFGTGTFEVKLSDGRTVALNKVNLGSFLPDDTTDEAIYFTNGTAIGQDADLKWDTTNGYLKVNGSTRIGSSGDPGAFLHVAVNGAGKIRVENTGSLVADYGIEFYKEGVVDWIIQVDDSNSNNLSIDDAAAPSSTPHMMFSSSNRSVIMGSSTLNANNDNGLTIHQQTGDDEAISLKSLDIAHGVTSDTETDTYAFMRKFNATEGGLELGGYSETDDALVLRGVATTTNSTKSTSAVAPVEIQAFLKSGSTTTTFGSNANIFAVKNGTSARLWLDEDGDMAVEGNFRAGSIGTPDAALHAREDGAVSVRIDNSGTNDGDTMLEYFKNGSVTWIVGVDDSNGDNLIIEDASAPTSAPHMMFNNADRGVYIGTNTANTGNTHGLTIQVDANTNEALSIKGSGIAHGITDEAETDTAGFLQMGQGAQGGLRLTGLTEDVRALYIRAMVTSNNTARSTAATGGVLLSTSLKTGTGLTTNGADGNLFVVADHTSARFLVDKEGDVHYDETTNASAWDDYDDIKLLQAFRSLSVPSFKQALGEFVDEHLDILDRTGVITKNEDGHHFVSTKGITGLIIDSIRQLAQRVETIESNPALAAAKPQITS